MNLSFFVGLVFGYRYASNIEEFVSYMSGLCFKKKEIFQVPDFDETMRKFTKT